MLNTAGMIYKNLGNTGLKVSLVSFGNMVNNKQVNKQVDHALIKKCLERGINFFDTAQIYGEGTSEQALGRSLIELGIPRQQVVIATKTWLAKNPEINSTRSTNRKHIKQSLDQSLKRLQMDYIDLLYAHAFDYDTSLQQICQAYHEVIEEGKVFYWGTSNWTAQQVMEAFSICQKFNLHKPICAQNQYNMLIREDFELTYRKLFEIYKYGCVGWSPLGGGFLTGKYLDGISNQSVNRLNDPNWSQQWLDSFKIFFYDRYNNQKSNQRLRQVQKIAEQMGYKLHHLALAWALKFKYANSMIIGARNADQLEDTLKSLELMQKITPEIEGKINKILDNNTTVRLNYNTWKSDTPLRPVASE